MIDFPRKYDAARPDAAGIARMLKTALPIIAPVPMSFSAKNTPTAEEKISGPDVPNGMSIAPMRSLGKFKAENGNKMNQFLVKINILVSTYLHQYSPTMSRKIRHKGIRSPNNNR